MKYSSLAKVQPISVFKVKLFHGRQIYLTFGFCMKNNLLFAAEQSREEISITPKHPLGDNEQYMAFSFPRLQIPGG